MTKQLITMPQYEAYKDSGLAWLASIPEHWQTKKVKHVLYFYTGGTPSSHVEGYYDGNEPWVTISDLSGKTTNKHHFISKRGINAANIPLIKKGSLLFSFKLSVGQVAFTHKDLYTNEAIAAFVDKDNLNLNYWYYALPVFVPNNSATNIYGAFILNQDLIKNASIITPPIKEQTAIANFLDKKTTKIDQAIAIKEKQITLLKERKQILIQNAVTRGLNPNVPMRDSGVEWIGEIPAHWEVKALKYILSEKLKYGANEAGIEYCSDLPRYIRITDFSGEGKLNETSKLSLPWNIGKQYLLSNGDILFARSGATVGKSYQFKTSMSSEKHYSFAGYLIKASADETQILSDYLNYYVNSECFNGWKQIIFNKATIENIGADKYSVLPVIIPTLKEQTELVEFISQESNKIDKAIALQKQQIEKLKEYKATLINSAVTGKIKVA